jgi:hypothetical protein
VQIPEVEFGGKYGYMRANAQMYTSCLIGISIQMSTSWVDFTVSYIIVQINIVWYILKPDLKQKYLNKGNSLKDLFSQFVSSKMTTVQIPEVEFGGKYGYMRANMDICPVFALRANNQH